MMRQLAVIFVALAVCAFAQGDEYQASIYGMQGLRLTCNTEPKLNFVRSYEGRLGFDFLRLTRSLSEPVELFVVADELEQFKVALTSEGIEYEIFVDDLSTIIEQERIQQKLARLNRAKDGIFSYFPRYEEIQSYLYSVEVSHRDIVRVISIGKSFHGRDIIGVKLSTGGKNKPAIFIDAGIHAREWIAPTTALYAIEQIVNNATDILKNIDIYVIPLLNPDGYEYTHESPATRLWRKTRSVNSEEQRCIGVDANRNFGLEWNTVGASSSPCSDIFAGPKPFSEPETAALRDFLLVRKGLIKAYLTFHSYGSYLLHPWGFTTKLPENEPTLRCVAEKAAAELKKIRGTRYTIGSSTNVLYAAAGGSDDWAMGVVGADLAYTVELPGGTWGFVAPPKEIVPVGQETFEAIKVVAQFVEGNVCQKF